MNKQDLARVPGLPGNLSELIESESLATIARMANSPSHDLRHYLSVMYANAEFMTDGSIPQSERDELFREVRSAVRGITDLLDSLLLFTRTGRAVYPEYESITLVIQRSFEKVGSHPRARISDRSYGPVIAESCCPLAGPPGLDLPGVKALCL